MEPINVVVAADRGFCRQLAVTISGISEAAAGVPHRVHILHDGYGAELRRRVEESAGRAVSVEWVDARSTELQRAQLPDYLPEAALYRLRLPELLPRDVDRVIFLDTDVVVRGSLLDLWQAELGDALVGAVRDAVYPWAASPQCLDWRTLGVPPDMPYFNSGVLLIPLERWRAARLGTSALDLLATHALRYGDQCALNAVVSGRWQALPPHWNLQSGHVVPDSVAWVVESAADMERALREPTVVHFTWFLGQRKPWEPRSTTPHRDLWFEALDRTAWAGWRPDDSAPSRVSMLAQRARRAAGTLVHGA